MASFHEIQFPPDISHGAVGGPGFKTVITTLAGGAEKRNIEWSKAKGAWDVAKGLQTQAQVDVLYEFFYARAGRAYGFRFKDWTDFKVPNLGGGPQSMFVTDGSTRPFQMIKTYTDAGGTYVRNIYKPISGTLAVFDNGVPTSDFAASYTTGIVTLGVTLAGTTGHTISAFVDFDVPVRFDTDDLKITIADVENLAWGQIPLVEIRDIT